MSDYPKDPFREAMLRAQAAMLMRTRVEQLRSRPRQGARELARRKRQIAKKNGAPG